VLLQDEAYKERERGVVRVEVEGKTSGVRVHQLAASSDGAKHKAYSSSEVPPMVASD
jgi:hypothetical protein